MALLTASQRAAFVFHLAAQCTQAGGHLQITAVALSALCALFSTTGTGLLLALVET